MRSDESDEFVGLLPGLLNGDRTCEESFFRLASRRLQTWATSSFMIPEKDREDFAIEVIEKALMRIGRFSPTKGRLVTWLFVIARHHAIDRSRRLNSGRDVLNAALSEDILEWRPLAFPDAQTESDETAPTLPSKERTALAEALSRLPECDRELLFLAYSGLNATEISEQLLHQSADNVRQRHRRLLRKLREMLAHTVPTGGSN